MSTPESEIVNKQKRFFCRGPSHPSKDMGILMHAIYFKGGDEGKPVRYEPLTAASKASYALRNLKKWSSSLLSSEGLIDIESMRNLR